MMRLNMDCVRDVLLCAEEHTGLYSFCAFLDNSDFSNHVEEALGRTPRHLPEHQLQLERKYSNEELLYHVNYCAKADLIELNKELPSELYVTDLTPKGHDFLENIRENRIWSSVKDVAGKVGSKSLEAVVQIASNVITELIRSHFSL